MDPEAAAFLRKIAKTLTIGFVWLALTCVFALKGDSAFINDHIRLGNVLFYLWFVVSVVALVVIYKKLWGNDKANQDRNDFLP